MRIREIRKTLGISQRELARRVSIDHSRLSRLERGETLGAVDLLAELAAALGVSPADLLAPRDNTTQMRVGDEKVSGEHARQWVRGAALLHPGNAEEIRAAFAALPEDEQNRVMLEYVTPEKSPIARAAVPEDEKKRRAQRAEDNVWELTEGERQRRKSRSRKEENDG